VKVNRKIVVLVVFGFVLLVAILSIIGVVMSSNWDTFVPDLINGVIGAGAIAAVIAWLQHLTEVRRSHAEKVTAAYENLMDAVTPLRQLDMRVAGEAKHFSVLNTRMIQLVECVGQDEESMAEWFEAERQLGLNRALTCFEALDAAGAVTPDEHLKILDPFMRWTAEFGNNVRFWRTGRLTAAEMSSQAAAIEKELRAVGAWREVAMPWRDSGTGAS
jgi:hypothetical protein